MCLFPSFAEKYEAVYRFIIEGQGPLPMFWRNYLAIMVSLSVMRNGGC